MYYMIFDSGITLIIYIFNGYGWLGRGEGGEEGIDKETLGASLIMRAMG